MTRPDLFAIWKAVKVETLYFLLLLIPYAYWLAMDNPDRCPACGATIPPDSPTGFCPKCLLNPDQWETIGIEKDTDAFPGDASNPDPEWIGPYRLISILGEGGMGQVFEAEQRDPIRRKVALKLIKPGMSSKEVLARFEAERQTVALMDHPNIARVYDAGTTEDGLPYFVMELVHGERLTDYCDNRKLSVRQRLELFQLICKAVQHAHQKGIIHRDLKPTNILVCSDAENADSPVPKIIDFGVAKALGPALTADTLYTLAGQVIGTPEYMSPEQATLESFDIDTRSDIYALGVILYELLTGSTPLRSADLKKSGLEEMLRCIREVEPAKPSLRITTSEQKEKTSIAQSRHTEPQTLVRTISKDLDWIVMKTIEKERSRRYATASELDHDISLFLNEQPVSAGPPSVAYRFQKFARRNRRVVLSAALVTVSLVVATGLSSWQAVRATNAENRAEAEALKANLTVRDAMMKAWGAARVSFDLAENHSSGMAHMAEAIRYSQQLPEELQNSSLFVDAALRLMNMPPQPRTLEYEDPGRNIGFSLDGSEVGMRAGVGNKEIVRWDARTGIPLRDEPDKWWSLGIDSFGPKKDESPLGFWRLRRDPLQPRVVEIHALPWAPDSAWSYRNFESLRHSSEVEDVTFSPNGKQVLATISRYNDNDEMQSIAAYLWTAPIRTTPGFPIRTQEGFALVDFSADGKWILCMGIGPKDLHIREVETLATVLEIEMPDEGIHRARFSPCGRWILIEYYSNYLEVWGTRSGRAIASSIPHDIDYQEASFSADGDLVLAVSPSEVNVIFCSEDPSRTTISLPDAKFTYAGFVDSETGTQVSTCSDDGHFRLWDPMTGNQLREPLKCDWALTALGSSPDGNWMVSASDLFSPGEVDSHFSAIQIWNIDTGDAVGPAIRHESQILHFSFSPCSRWIVTSGHDKIARVWEVATSLPVGAPMHHEDHVETAIFSSNNKWVVTSSGAGFGSARLWDVNTGLPLGEPMKHRDVLWNSILSPDMRWVATASRDGSARIWEVYLSEYSAPMPGELELIPLALETLGGSGIDQFGNRFSRSQGKDLEILQELLNESPDSAWSRLIRWKMEDPTKRTISPHRKSSVSDVLRMEVEWLLGQEFLDGYAYSPEIYAMDPGHPLIPFIVALLEADEEKKDYFISQGMKSIPEAVEDQILAAKILHKLEKWADARKVVQEILESDPNHTDARNLLENIPEG